MVKYLAKHGNSLALVIDKGILELLGIDAQTPLSVVTDGKALLVRPAKRRAPPRGLRKALDELDAEWAPALDALADL